MNLQELQAVVRSLYENAKISPSNSCPGYGTWKSIDAKVQVNRLQNFTLLLYFYDGQNKII